MCCPNLRALWSLAGIGRDLSFLTLEFSGSSCFFYLSDLFVDYLIKSRPVSRDTGSFKQFDKCFVPSFDYGLMPDEFANILDLWFSLACFVEDESSLVLLLSKLFESFPTFYRTFKGTLLLTSDL